jgi:hypothetical protein
MERFGKARVREVASIAALALEGRELRGIATPETDGSAGARELDRERRTPGAGAEHRHHLGARLALFVGCHRFDRAPAGS